jgi:putative peptidoglycan lipid II flippase
MGMSSTELIIILVIVVLLFGAKNFILSVGIIIASIMRMLWVYTDLKSMNISYASFLLQIKSRKLEYKTLIFMIFANGLMFINPIIDKLFAVYFQEGSVAILSYAEKIYLLPVSVFLTTYAVAMFPDLSKLAVNGRKSEVAIMLKKSISLNIIISFIVGLLLHIFSYFTVSLFFGIAGLEDNVIGNVSTVLNAYIISLVMAGTNSILLNLVFSYKLYNSLMLYAIFMVLCNTVLDFTVLKLGYNIEYIAYVTSFVSVLSVVYLSVLYKIRLKQ